MFKVLLQYLISVCLLSAILLHLRMISKEVWETKEMTSVLYMERLESQKFEEEKFERNLKFEEDEKCVKENTLTGCHSVHQSKLRSSKKHLKDAEKKSCETDVQLSHSTQYCISIDLCLLFAYHTASKKSSAEAIFLATTALLFWKVSAIPIDCRNAEKRDGDQAVFDEKHERKLRSVSTKSQFYQGDCQAEWSQSETRCYRLFQEKMNFETAVKHCESFESKLVALRTKEENSFVDKLTSEFSVGYLWTGVQKLRKNCSAPGAYVNWHPGQPDHDGNCVVMVNAGQWMDFDCRYMFAFVCEKGVAKPPYSRQQRLIALLVPIFSCLTLAITFTTALLVSSVRRGTQPFKIASRYGRTKRQRKIATWNMLDTLRRASLTRRNSKQRPHRGSIPNIEITKPETDNAESEKQSQAQKAREVKFQETKKQSRYKTKVAKPFLAPTERRRSSGSSSNSSLYELLVRLNGMAFVPPKDDSQTIELREFRQVRAETEIPVPDAGEDREKLVAKNEASVRENTRECSFQNMAFRDSVASVETNASSVVSCLEQRKDIPSKNSVVLSQISEPNIAKLNSQSPNCESSDLEADKNRKTVKVDVHRISKSKASPPAAINGSAQTSEPKNLSEGNVVWTYSI